MNLRQSSVFGSNHATVNGGVGVGGIAAVGVAAAAVMFASVVAAIVGAALALMVVVIGSTVAGCIALMTCTTATLKVLYYRRTGQLAPRQPLVVFNRTEPAQLEDTRVHTPRMTVTRADYSRDERLREEPWSLS